VWTLNCRIVQTAAVLAWNAIERLRDHFGDYVIVVSCDRCRHASEISPASLVPRCRDGWDEPIARVVSRFRCQCGARQVEVQIGFNKKPRGWVKNPS
jgi:imidazole glycerol phosphate synthase subunit HisF